jgi:hypothetical protein
MPRTKTSKEVLPVILEERDDLFKLKTMKHRQSGKKLATTPVTKGETRESKTEIGEALRSQTPDLVNKDEDE